MPKGHSKNPQITSQKIREKQLGCGNSFYGKKHTPETIEKIRQASLGKTFSPETRKKLSDGRTGIKFSSKWCENIRKSQLGKKLSEETKEKIGLAQRGKIVSKETRIKLSVASLGRKMPQKGKIISKEQRERQSEYLKKRILEGTWTMPSCKGLKRSLEAIEKTRKALLGSKRTPEQRRQMSLGRMGIKNHMFGKTFSEKTLRQMSESRKGDKSIWWKGGITPMNRVVRNSLDYKLWCRAVFKRDNYTCQVCGIRNKKGYGKTVVLNAHHIKPFAYFPELRFDVNNGLTVCVPCHKLTDSFKKRCKNI